MDPVTIALFAAGANMLGSMMKGNADSKAAELNAQTLEGDAATADRAAGDAILRGQLLEGRTRAKGTAVGSAQASAFAASGVDVKSGSALDVQATTAGQSALDALMVRSNAARDAWGFETRAAQLRRQAAVTRATGKAQASADILGGAVGSARYLMPFLTVGGQGGGAAGLGGSGYASAGDTFQGG